MPKQPKKEDIDKRIERAFGKACKNVQLDATEAEQMFSLSRVFVKRRKPTELQLETRIASIVAAFKQN